MEEQKTQSRAYRELLRMTRRFARTSEEAEDLAQEVLLVALESAVDDWSSLCRRPWLYGVVRKRAAFNVRGAVRRRKREGAELDVLSGGLRAWVWKPEFLRSLPRSLQVVAKLASADLTADEIRWLLGISPTALRTRLTTLRRAVRGEEELPIVESAGPRFGRKRGVLLSRLKRASARAIGTLDPDGHALFFSEVAHRTSTSGNKK